MKNIWSVYQTNKKNLLGGLMTYSTLSEAMEHLDPANGVNTIFCTTYVNSEWWHGKPMPYLTEILSRGVVYRA